MEKNLSAIIEAAGKQFRVEPNQVLDIEGLALTKSSKKIVFDKILSIRKGDSFEVGTPFIKGASVACELIEEIRGPKKVIFKMRRRKNYRRKNGFRSVVARLRVKEITL